MTELCTFKDDTVATWVWKSPPETCPYCGPHCPGCGRPLPWDVTPWNPYYPPYYQPYYFSNTSTPYTPFRARTTYNTFRGWSF